VIFCMPCFSCTWGSVRGCPVNGEVIKWQLTARLVQAATHTPCISGYAAMVLSSEIKDAWRSIAVAMMKRSAGHGGSDIKS
jgi:hypothetical protein